MAIFSREPAPVKRGTVASVASTAGTAAKWGAAGALLGVLAAVALPVGLGAVTYAVVTSPAVGGFGAAAAAVIGGILTLASVPTSFAALGIGAAGGGLFGIFKGTSRVSRQNEAYLDKVEEVQDRQANLLNNSYAKGAQDAEYAMMQRLHDMAANGQRENVGRFTGNAINNTAAPGVSPNRVG